MKALKLLKKVTTVNILTALLLMASSFYLNNAVAETASSDKTAAAARIETDAQCKNNLISRNNDFKESCAKAGLGGDPKTCREKIEICNEFEFLEEEEKRDSDYKHCYAADATTSAALKTIERLEKKRDRAEESVKKSDEKIEKLTDDYHSTTEEINDLAQKRIQAQETFEQAIAEIDSEKAEALSTTTNQIETLQLTIIETQDKITAIYLEQQQMLIENKMNCRGQANQAAQAVEQRAFARKRSGQTYLSISGMLARSGRSARDEAIETHNRVMRNCTSLGKASKNKLDQYNFRDQYLLKRSQDKQRIKILKTEVRRLERRKAVAKNYYETTLQQLTTKQKRIITAHIKQMAYLQNVATQLSQKRTNIQYKLLAETQSQNSKQNQLQNAEIELQKAEAKLTVAQRNGATEEKENAFIDAISKVDSLDEIEEINERCGITSTLIEDAKNRQNELNNDGASVGVDIENKDVEVVLPALEDAETDATNNGGSTSNKTTNGCITDPGGGQKCMP